MTAAANDGRVFANLVGEVVSVIQVTLPVLIALAFMVFVWGLAKFIYQAGDTKAANEGKNLIKWGLIALFVLASFMGLISIAYNDLGLGDYRPLGFPLLPTHNTPQK